jgi:hypothetical protein
MKTWVLVVAMLLVAVGCATLAWAQEQVVPVQPAKPEQAAKPEQPIKPEQAVKPKLPAKTATVVKAKAIGGEIVSVDTTAKTISLKYKSGKTEKTETFAINPKVIVNKAGKSIALTDLSAGEKVSVGYETKAGKNIATRITVRTPPERKALKAKKVTAPAPK